MPQFHIAAHRTLVLLRYNSQEALATILHVWHAFRGQRARTPATIEGQCCKHAVLTDRMHGTQQLKGLNTLRTGWGTESKLVTTLQRGHCVQRLSRQSGVTRMTSSAPKDFCIWESGCTDSFDHPVSKKMPLRCGALTFALRLDAGHPRVEVREL